MWLWIMLVKLLVTANILLLLFVNQKPILDMTLKSLGITKCPKFEEVKIIIFVATVRELEMLLIEMLICRTSKLADLLIVLQ